LIREVNQVDKKKTWDEKVSRYRSYLKNKRQSDWSLGPVAGGKET